MIEYLRKILYLLGDSRKKIPIMLIIFLMSSFLDLVGIGMIAPYIALILDPNSMDGILAIVGEVVGLPKERESLLIATSLILLVVFLVKTLSVILINRLIINFSQDQEVRLRSFLMRSYQSLPYVEYLRRNSSEYIHSIHNLTGQFSSQILLPLLRTLSDGMVAIFILGLLAWQNVSALVLLVILLGTIIIFYDKLFRYKVTLYGKRVNEHSTSMVQGIHEGIEGLKEIRILGREKYFINKVVNNAKTFAFYNKKSQILSIAPRYLLEFTMIAFIVLLVVSTLLLGMDVRGLVPTLGVFGVAALRLLPASNSISTSLVQLRYGRDAVNRLYGDLSGIKQFELNDSNSSFEETDHDLFQKLLVDNITFTYPNTKQKILKKISLEIKAGESIGIMGISGSGKTTLIDILLGLLNVQSGRINYNGKPLNLMLNKWQSQIAYLPQQVFLVDDTLQRNVALGIDDHKINKEQLYKALKQSQLIELAEQLPQGIDTVLGERGIRLSGGQRQRIALARAFYHERDILIMDEATSALDNETEREIVKEIEQLKGDKTMIVIAHRLTTLQHCDRIYELKDGKIVSVGSYKDLVMNHES